MRLFAHELSSADRGRVTQAITLAEKDTSGEIVVVAAHASDDYIHVPIHIATAAALAVPLAVPLLMAISPWSAISMQGLFLMQLCLFIGLALVLSLPFFRHAITPRKLMHKYAHRNAAAQFLASNITATRKRTGVLIFVSLHERYVEVIGDRDIAEKLSQRDWQKIIDDMLPLLRDKKTVDALVLAVERCGQLLTAHFPAGESNPNELPDRFIVLD